MPKVRLDQLLVDRSLASSREEAKRMILAGLVSVTDGAPAKPGRQVDAAARVEVRGPKCPFVSRGGLKLAAALGRFGIDPAGAGLALDIGASTGGFTDCLLQRGAARVVAVDTGRGKIHEKLRADPRVTLLENRNARGLELEAIGGERAGLISIDVSFISLRLILPAMAGLLREGGSVVALVKPQFEAGRERVGRGGIVRDPAAREDVLRGLADFCGAQGWRVMGAMASPILGAEGNAEFFLSLRRGPAEGGGPEAGGEPIDAQIQAALDEATRLQGRM